MSEPFQVEESATVGQKAERGSATEFLRTLRGVPSLNLFPTENRMSPRALEALTTDAVNRYPGSVGDTFFYGDTSGLAGLYASCIDLTKEFFGADSAMVNFLSGLHAMWSVITSLCPRGGVVAHLDPERGGHYATNTILKNLGYRTWTLPFDPSQCQIDLEEFAARVSAEPPDVVYLDASTTIRLLPVAELRSIVGRETFICLDASHLLGLMPILDSQIGLAAGATTVSGSTHKTFPGPQKGLLVTNSAAAARKLNDSMPFAVSSAHASSVGALAITLDELMPHRFDYARAIIENARSLGSYLAEKGFLVCGGDFGFTENHQLWIDPPPGADGIEWARRLCDCNVRVTAVVLPITGSVGLRLGAQELTRVGMGKAAMKEVSTIFASCLLESRPAEEIRRAVAALSEDHKEVSFIKTSPGPIDGLSRTDTTV